MGKFGNFITLLLAFFHHYCTLMRVGYRGEKSVFKPLL